MLVLDCSAEPRREGRSARRAGSSAAEWVAVMLARWLRWRAPAVQPGSENPDPGHPDCGGRRGGCDELEEGGAEGGAGGGVDERGVVEGGDDGVGRGGLDGGGVGFGGEREGELVEVGGVVGVGDFDEGDEGGGVDGGGGGDAGGADGAGLAAEPALLRDVGGEDAVEAGGEVFEDGDEGARGCRERRRSGCGGFLEEVDDGVGGTRGGGLELEPEEGVGRERDGVGSFVDDGEGDVAEHLDGLAAGEPGEVERDGLGEAGEVGDAEDGFGLWPSSPSCSLYSRM